MWVQVEGMFRVNSGQVLGRCRVRLGLGFRVGLAWAWGGFRVGVRWARAGVG